MRKIGKTVSGIHTRLLSQTIYNQSDTEMTATEVKGCVWISLRGNSYKSSNKCINV